MSRRIGLLAVALIVAMLGTFAVFSYVSKVEARTLDGAEPVDVLVASERLVAGTSGKALATSQLVQLVPMPRKSVPEGALTALDSVGAQTLVSDVFAGEVLLRAKFADQTARTGNLVIPKDKIAMSVELGDPQRVAGFVVPGSEVAIFVTIANASNEGQEPVDPSAPAPAAGGGGEADDTVTRLLLPRTSVIAVGPSTLRPTQSEQPADEEAVAKAVLTVAVTQAEAERLVHATQGGSLYMGLLSATSQTAPALGTTNSTLFQ